jgi:hypothetical protein
MDELRALQRKVDLLTLLLGVNVVTTAALLYFVIERLP